MKKIQRRIGKRAGIITAVSYKKFIKAYIVEHLSRSARDANDVYVAQNQTNEYSLKTISNLIETQKDSRSCGSRVLFQRIEQPKMVMSKYEIEFDDNPRKAMHLSS